MHYADTEQISKKAVYKYKQPKYDKSTTDPTYYEPAATRIANMRRSAGVQYEGIYDFYEKSDVEKFTEKNFSKNIINATPDIKYQKGLTQEEISQVTNNISNDVDTMIDKKKFDTEKKNKRMQEAIETSDAINKSTTQNNNTEE